MVIDIKSKKPGFYKIQLHIDGTLIVTDINDEELDNFENFIKGGKHQFRFNGFMKKDNGNTMLQDCSIFLSRIDDNAIHFVYVLSDRNDIDVYLIDYEEMLYISDLTIKTKTKHFLHDFDSNIILNINKARHQSYNLSIAKYNEPANDELIRVHGLDEARDIKNNELRTYKMLKTHGDPQINFLTIYLDYLQSGKPFEMLTHYRDFSHFEQEDITRKNTELYQQMVAMMRLVDGMDFDSGLYILACRSKIEHDGVSTIFIILTKSFKLDDEDVEVYNFKKQKDNIVIDQEQNIQLFSILDPNTTTQSDFKKDIYKMMSLLNYTTKRMRPFVIVSNVYTASELYDKIQRSFLR